MNQTVIGLFNKSSEAQQAVQQLTSNGFTNDNVDMSLSYENSGSTSTDFKLDTDHNEHESGVSRFFKNLFGDNDTDTNADKYSKAASRGKSVVTVHTHSSEEAERAADILDDCGAVDVDDNADENNANTTGNTYNTAGAAPVGAFGETTGTTIGTTNTSNTYDADTNSNVTNKSIPIIEENLEIGKKMVQTGGVRLKSRIVEKPVEEELRLRKERVYVQRNPVDRAASSADFDTFKEGEMEVTEHAEVPVVNKQARVVEEVSLGKDVDERTETIRDTVRKTEVDVEDLTGQSKSDSTWRDNS